MTLYRLTSCDLVGARDQIKFRIKTKDLLFLTTNFDLEFFVFFYIIDTTNTHTVSLIRKHLNNKKRPMRRRNDGYKLTYTKKIL